MSCLIAAGQIEIWSRGATLRSILSLLKNSSTGNSGLTVLGPPNTRAFHSYPKTYSHSSVKWPISTFWLCFWSSSCLVWKTCGELHAQLCLWCSSWLFLWSKMLSKTTCDVDKTMKRIEKSVSVYRVVRARSRISKRKTYKLAVSSKSRRTNSFLAICWCWVAHYLRVLPT